MSSLILGGAWPVISMDDERALAGLDEIRHDNRAYTLRYDAGDALIGGVSWATEWWPAGCVDMGGTLGVLEGKSYGFPVPFSGSNGRLAIVGYSRDAYGSPLPNAVVKLFRTVDDSLQANVVSDGNGVYQVTSPYADGHYLVVYKTGPPDVCGTTINTLSPG